MELVCSECGTRSSLANQGRCLRCGAMLRRCADCTNYSTQVEVCRVFGVEIEAGEARRPGPLATSVSCAHYRPVPQRRAA